MTFEYFLTFFVMVLKIFAYFNYLFNFASQMLKKEVKKINFENRYQRTSKEKISWWIVTHQLEDRKQYAELREKVKKERKS